MADVLGEFDLVTRYLRPLATLKGAFGLLDDAACLNIPANYDLVISKDMLVADVHFFKSDPADLIARKALRANFSDIIAKGAKPLAYSLGLGFPAPPTKEFMEGFSDGLRKDQVHFNISLLGGDTTRTKADFIISVTAYGLVETGKMVTRLKAKAGDGIYVTGCLGDAALGLAARLHPARFEGLIKADMEYLLRAYLLPMPPVDIHSVICAYAHASMDISDGFFNDLSHICTASGVSAKVDYEALPFSKSSLKAMQLDTGLEEAALCGGDDYQCLFTVAPEDEVAMARECRHAKILISRIGEIIPMQEINVKLLKSGQNHAVPTGGYVHF